MARKIYRGYARDGNGTVLSGATVSVYLTGTSTVASIYTASTGGTAVNSTTTDATGLYSFYVDTLNYDWGTQFCIIISKTGYDSITYDEIECLPTAKTPYFYAYASADTENVTGDGTAYDAGGIWSELDSRAMIASGVFTVPSTGFYQLSGNYYLGGIASNHTILYCGFHDTTNSVYYMLFRVNPYAMSVTSLGTIALTGSCLYYLAKDTTIQYYISVAGGSKVVDILTGSSFTGYRVS